MISALADRRPAPSLDRLVADLVPPPRFSEARFSTYVPDPQFPSQAEAKQRLERFATQLGGAKSGGLLAKLTGRRSSGPAQGLYLDGGFGVGKTHLLTSLFHAAPGHRLYGTFVEYTNLVGALGFRKAVELFSGASLVCIDEFELDDVGDTLLMTRLIRELSDAGVSIVATSNTLPESLGEGRFAAQDFLREIQAMAERFEVLRIDGHDYRHRDAITEPPVLDDAQVAAHAEATPGTTLDGFDALMRHLADVHLSRYGALIDDVVCAHLTGVRTLDDHKEALRFVVLVDRLYDREVPVVMSGARVEDVYTAGLLESGYRKKYYRSLSRLGSLASDGARALAC